jgi:hypothetical protein
MSTPPDQNCAEAGGGKLRLTYAAPRTTSSLIRSGSQP